MRESTSLRDRERIAEWANRVGVQSRYSGAPYVHAKAERETLIAWLQWNDPNGTWTDADMRASQMDPMTKDDAWEQLEMVQQQDDD